MNNYGTILSDFTRPFDFRVKQYQYRHPDPCAQFTKNLHQTNRWDILLPDPHLTDIESELRILNYKLSKLPEDRYQAYSEPIKNFDSMQNECKKKIVRQYYSNSS